MNASERKQKNAEVLLLHELIEIWAEVVQSVLTEKNELECRDESTIFELFGTLGLSG